MNTKTALVTLSALIVIARAQAATPLDITVTGSTAIRADLFNSIIKLYQSDFKQNPTANYTKANQVTWSGTIPVLQAIGYDPVTVRCGMSGSVQGVTDLANKNAISVLANSTDTDTNRTTRIPDFSMSDVFQDTAGVSGGADLTDAKVAVIPFTWVRGAGSSSAIANMNVQLMQKFLANGALPLRFWSGNPADTNNVYLIGRDSGSGTRATIMADSFYGVTAATKIYTNYPAADTTPLNLGLPTPADNAYASGGSVAKTLAVNDGSGPFQNRIGYAGISDALTVDQSQSLWLSYNGVLYSTNAVQNGQYTFWGYEHLFDRTDDASAFNYVKTFQSALATQIDAEIQSHTPPVTSISLGVMRVGRNGDGANLFAK